MARPTVNAQVPQSAHPTRSPSKPEGGLGAVFYSNDKSPSVASHQEILPFRTIGPFLGLGKIKTLKAPSQDATALGQEPKTPPLANRQGYKGEVPSSRLQNPSTLRGPQAGLGESTVKTTQSKTVLFPSGRVAAGGRSGKPVLPKSSPRQRSGRPQRPGWMRDFLVTWSSDLFLVLISLWVLFTLALVLSAVTEPKGVKSGIEHILSLKPVAFLAALKPWVGGLGLLGIYFCYVLTFRVFVGQTLGQSILKRRQTLSQQGIGAVRSRENSL